jgi:hypothetical protein
MQDLEEAWELALAEATERARQAGRTDIARYLDLKRRNDLLRRAAGDWLNQAVLALAADANRKGAAIQIEQHAEHRFRRGTATMVGSRLVLRRGVRALTVEIGWPRKPGDGIVRGNGLACANLKHLGRPKLDDELMLLSSASGSPQWFVLKDREQTQLTEGHLMHHVSGLTQP